MNEHPHHGGASAFPIAAVARLRRALPVPFSEGSDQAHLRRHAVRRELDDRDYGAGGAGGGGARADSKRTTAALKVAKEWGRRIGGNCGNLPPVSAAGASAGAKTRKSPAQQRSAKLRSHVTGRGLIGIAHCGTSGFLARGSGQLEAPGWTRRR